MFLQLSSNNHRAMVDKIARNERMGLVKRIQTIQARFPKYNQMSIDMRFCCCQLYIDNVFAIIVLLFVNAYKSLMVKLGIFSYPSIEKIASDA